MTDAFRTELSEESKASMRNYAMMMGFLTIFIFFALTGTYFFRGIKYIDMFSGDSLTIKTMLCVMLFISAIVLVFLHRRDEFAVLFIVISLFIVLYDWSNMLFGWSGWNLYYPMYIVLTLVVFMLSFTRNEQSIVFLILSAMLFIYGLVAATGHDTLFVNGISYSAIAALAGYIVICIGSGNPKFPGYDMLTTDAFDVESDGSEFEFAESGAALGYMLLAMPMLAYVMHYLNVFNVTLNDCYSILVISGVVLTFVGILMLVTGNIRALPFTFIVLGILGSMITFTKDVGYILLFLYALAAVITYRRIDNGLIFSIAITIFGVGVLLSTTFSNPSLNVVIAILNILPFIMCTYISFALCSDGRLPIR